MRQMMEKMLLGVKAVGITNVCITPNIVTSDQRPFPMCNSHKWFKTQNTNHEAHTEH